MLDGVDPEMSSWATVIAFGGQVPGPLQRVVSRSVLLSLSGLDPKQRR